MSRQSIRGRFAWFTAYSAARIVLSLGTLPLMTAILGPYEYGLFAVGIAVATMFGTVASVGTSVVLISRYSGAPHDEQCRVVSNLAATGLIVGFASAAVMLAAWPFTLTRLLVDFAEIDVAMRFMLATGVVTGALAVVASEVLALSGRVALFAKVNFARDLVGAATTLIALYAFDAGLSSLFIGFAASYVFGFIASALVLRPYLCARPTWSETLRILHEWRVVVSNIMEQGLSIVERLLVGVFGGVAMIGIIAHSRSYESILKTAFKSLSRAAWPEVLEEIGGPGEAHPVIRATIRSSALLCGGVGIGIATVGSDAIGLLTNGKFNEAAPFAAAWCAILCAGSAELPQRALVYRRGASIVVARAGLWSSLIALSLLIALAPVLGAVAVVPATAGGTLCHRLVLFAGGRRLGAEEFMGRMSLEAAVLVVAAAVATLGLAESFSDRLALCALFLIVFLTRMRQGMLDLWRLARTGQFAR